LMLDQTRTRQIMFNLIGNAIKFTEKGFIKISVNAVKNEYKKDNVDLYIEIEDSGIGILSEQLTEIFDPFRQAKGQSNKYGGTGLGLAITKRLLEAMNGKIIAESEPEKGSTFKININDVQIAENSNPNPKVSITKVGINNEYKKAKILVVDDVESNREVIRYLLEEYGCIIIEKSDGLQAVEAAKKHNPDIIIMDIQMPVMEGSEAGRIIREFSNTPIIALTAFALNEQIEKYQGIFDDYLTKPISEEKLFECLSKYIHLALPAVSNEIENNDNLNTTIDTQQVCDILMYRITTEVIPLLNDIKDIVDIDDCLQLSELLIKLGNEFEFELFKETGKELSRAGNNFFLSEIDSIIKKLDNNIKTILT